MTVAQRLEHARGHNLCLNCLASGHRTSDCRGYGRCRTCRQKHNTLVHEDAPANSPIPSASTNAASTKPSPTIKSSFTMTSQVMLTGPTGKKMIVRALLDSGSNTSLVSAKTVSTLHLRKTSACIAFSGVQDTMPEPSHALVTLCMSPLQEPDKQYRLEAAVVPKVTCDLPLQGATGIEELPHIRGLKLADPTFCA